MIMKRILAIIILFIFLLGCGKEEKAEEITSGVIKDLEVEEVAEEKIEENITTVRICYDTDNGIVRWVNGTVMGFYDNATRFEFKDYCYNFNYLVEFYCENEIPHEKLFLCKNGCVDSHCS